MLQVSLVVLAYNVASYLGVCLKSIECQTLGDFETIIVDDGSVDETAQIALAMVDRDPRFRLVRNERNLGTFVSRRIGVAHTRGRYVCIVDGDDWLGPHYLEHLYKAASSSRADIVECASIAVRPDGRMVPIAQSEVSPSRLDGCAIVEATLRRSVWHVNWNKMFDRSLFDQARPQLESIDDHIVVADDKLFMLSLMLHARSFVRIPQVDYFYRIRVGSATHGVTAKSELRHVEDTMLVDAKLTRLFAPYAANPALLSALAQSHHVELRRIDRLMKRHARHSARRVAIARAACQLDPGLTAVLGKPARPTIRFWMALLRSPRDYLRLAMNLARRLLWLACRGPHVSQSPSQVQRPL